MKAHGMEKKRADWALRCVMSGLLVCATAATPALAATNAESYASGELTIHPAQGNEDMAYKAIKVFNGNARDAGKMSEVTWASSETRSAVVSAIQTADAGYVDPSSSNESAQAAAEFIATHIGDAQGTTAGTMPSQSTTIQPSAASFASALADAIDDLDAVMTIAADETATLDAGWYLVVSVDPSTGQAGTAPIFTLIGSDGEVVEIDEKTTVPTVEKYAYEDSTGTWSKAADANLGQEVSYRLEGTIASNFASYAAYSYTFTDTLSDGLSADASSIAVELLNGENATDVTSQFKTDVTGNVLTVAIDDVNTLDGISATSVLRVTYSAQITDTAAIGAAGNLNEVKVTYSNNPNKTTTSTSEGDDTDTYTYKLNIHKQDRNNSSRSLEGAMFTLQVASNNTDSDSIGMYVQADGSLASDPYEFTTDSNGDISIPRIDEGVYTLCETQAPAASDGSTYNTIANATITIASNISELANDTSGTAALELSATTDSTEATVDSDGVDAQSGTVSITVTDAKNTLMPKTGETGIALVIAVGLATAGCGIILARRKRVTAE